MRYGRRAALGWAALIACLGAMPGQARAQFGLAVGGVGPINRAMGGASTAAPIDAAGALYWNPATISGLDRNESEFATEVLIPRTTLTSRVAPGTFGPAWAPSARPRSRRCGKLCRG